MTRVSLTVVCTGALLFSAIPVSAQVDVIEDAFNPYLDNEPHIQQFLSSNPGADVFRLGDRVTRVYGRAFAEGADAHGAAEQFLQAHDHMFGVDRNDLVPAGPFADGHHLQPIGYLRETDTYKFTGAYYSHVVQGVPVYQSRVMTLSRNMPGSPVVLASSSLRDLGDFQLDEDAMAADAGLARNAVNAEFGRGAEVFFQQRVIYAGIDNDIVEPRLADLTDVRLDGFDEWRIITDVETGETLHLEHRTCRIDVSGNASGLATEGVGADFCEDEVSTPLPYLEVSIGGTSAFTDVNGDFTIPNGGATDVTVSGGLSGMWFDVGTFTGSETTESENVTPPGPADLVFNSDNSSENIRAQVNTYVEANRVRDFAIAANPAYPTLLKTSFEATANRTDGFCPGNAWYSPGDPSINFCSSGGGYPNTSWASVIHHEFGHHLVAAGGSGQGAYGEGMGDVVSTIILDDSRLGLGFFGNCSESLRSADNTLQYPCSGAIHFCGQLISGCVWDTRNELVITEPDDYQDILGFLAVNAIQMHGGSSIAPDITIDWLTLDDDNGDLCDGTPHYFEIAAGFGAHNMDAPGVEPLKLSFPNGLPATINPAGGTTLRVEITTLDETPQPGTGMLHYDDGGGLVSIPMVVIEPNVYDAVFPAVPCGTIVDYFLTAESTLGSTATYPCVGFYSTLSAGSTDPTLDDLEADTGWTVGAGGDDATTGVWVRVNPNATAAQPGDDHTSDPGTLCFVTGQGSPNGPVGENDVDGGKTTLTTPTYALADAEIAVISYWRWYSNDEGSTPNTDIFIIEVSDNNGASWTNVETVGPGGPESTGGWFFHQFFVDDIVSLTDQVQVRFIASDEGDGSIVEAAIDDFMVNIVSCTPSGDPADLDGNGSVGPEDLAILLGSWGPCPGCPEDLDGNGSVGPEDLAILLGSWG